MNAHELTKLAHFDELFKYLRDNGAYIEEYDKDFSDYVITVTEKDMFTFKFGDKTEEHFVKIVEKFYSENYPNITVLWPKKMAGQWNSYIDLIGGDVVFIIDGTEYRIDIKCTNTNFVGSISKPSPDYFGNGQLVLNKDHLINPNYVHNVDNHFYLLCNTKFSRACLASAKAVYANQNSMFRYTNNPSRPYITYFSTSGYLTSEECKNKGKKFVVRGIKDTLNLEDFICL